MWLPEQQGGPKIRGATFDFERSRRLLTTGHENANVGDTAKMDFMGRMAA
jgi:hypothetical protein